MRRVVTEIEANFAVQSAAFLQLCPRFARSLFERRHEKSCNCDAANAAHTTKTAEFTRARRYRALALVEPTSLVCRTLQFGSGDDDGGGGGGGGGDGDGDGDVQQAAVVNDDDENVAALSDVENVEILQTDEYKQQLLEKARRYVARMNATAASEAPTTSESATKIESSDPTPSADVVTTSADVATTTTIEDAAQVDTPNDKKNRREKKTNTDEKLAKRHKRKRLFDGEFEIRYLRKQVRFDGERHHFGQCLLASARAKQTRISQHLSSERKRI